MAGRFLEPTDELVAYLARWGARTDEVLDRVRAETAQRPDAAMQIAADQGALMELVVRLIGTKDALEVGTFTGYSAICIARGLADGGRLTCLELSEEFAAIARRQHRRCGRRRPGRDPSGPAKQALEAMPAEPTYDFAFIDADKPGYPDYYELVLARMRRGGLILLDNMLQGGRIVAPERESTRVIDALNRRIHADERVDVAMTVAADGLTFARVR